ncbi:MAG: TIGR00374 family protein [Melioribacteraceae bacterium]|nr:MAG: TIGR00374 family protein [Melioribacteraceae bacterium]
MEKLKKNILFFIIISIFIYFGLTLYADFDSVLESMTQIDVLILPVVFFLSLLNYITRFFKWHYYLRLLKIDVKFWDSFGIFMSGLAMSATPGKLGELLKSYLVKDKVGTPVSKTAPIIFAERLTDMISVIALAIGGALFYKFGVNVVIITGIFFLLIIIVISNRKMSLYLIDLISKIGFISKYVKQIRELYESAFILIRLPALIKMTLLSFVSWFFECYGYYLVLTGLGLDVSLFWSVFVYAFATIVGSITMLPGGLGATEGSITLLMVENGISKDLAVISTFIIRVATLWFAILLGVISLIWYQKKTGMNKIDANLDEIQKRKS